MHTRLMKIIFIMTFFILSVLTTRVNAEEDSIKNIQDTNRSKETPLIILSWNKYTFDIMKSNPSRGEETPIVIKGKIAGYRYQYYNATVVWSLAACANYGAIREQDKCTRFTEHILSHYSPKLVVSLQTGGMFPNSNKTNIGKLFKIVRINYNGKCFTIPNQIASDLSPAVELYSDKFQSKKQRICDSSNVMLSSNSLSFSKIMGGNNSTSPKLLVIAGLTNLVQDNPSLSEKVYEENKWAVALKMVDYVNRHFINIEIHPNKPH